MRPEQGNFFIVLQMADPKTRSLLRLEQIF